METADTPTTTGTPDSTVTVTESTLLSGPPTIRTFGPSAVRDATSSLPVVAPSPPVMILDNESQEAHSSGYTCRQCGHNCSTGDIKEAMTRRYTNDEDAVNESRARSFGWTPETPYHFFEVIRHVENRVMSFVCPMCYIKHPFKNIDEQEFLYQYRVPYKMVAEKDRKS